MKTPTVNFHQVVNQTREEKIAMYKKMPKFKICEMLAECSRIIDGYTHIPQLNPIDKPISGEIRVKKVKGMDLKIGDICLLGSDEVEVDKDFIRSSNKHYNQEEIFLIKLK